VPAATIIKKMRLRDAFFTFAYDKNLAIAEPGSKVIHHL
jgi:hypothetical protein